MFPTDVICQVCMTAPFYGKPCDFVSGGYLGRFRQEVLAARRMLEHVAGLGIRPQNLAADKAYGSGELLAWLLARDIQPHIPVIDRRHQTRGTSRSTFRDR